MGAKPRADQPPLEEFLRWLDRADRDGATDLVMDLVRSGWTTDRVVTQLLVPAQEVTGLRWLTTEWSVADEHAATATIDAVLASVAAAISPAEFRSPIVVACVEGEWHSLPSRMLAELLRVRGWRAFFLGGSLPASDLGRFVARVRPLALVLSCSQSVHLAGAARSIEAGHRSDVPVLAGGPGFGPDERRALRLGADAWASSADDASTVLDRWERRSGPVDLAAPGALTHEYYLLQSQADAVVARILRALKRRRIEPSATNVTYLVNALIAATLTDDVRVLAEAVAWLKQFLATRGFAPIAIEAMVHVVAQCVPPDLTAVTGLIDRFKAGDR